MRRKVGVTLVELLLVLAILGVVASIGFVNFRVLGNDVHNGAGQIAGGFKQARARAMATTSAYRVVRVSETALRAEFAVNCAAAEDAWTVDERFELRLEGAVTITSIDDPASGDVVLCFNSRGLSNSNPTITLTDREGRTATVEVFIGGAVDRR
ncbi:MAG: prepilin-type N-terminal cleavage/methylation domain-containing protein [Trueperaceae bacterium]|nr:prepilin-type N-terminal cleavage/methylation domain-containing protein [Trueperaceae bacterium]